MNHFASAPLAGLVLLALALSAPSARAEKFALLVGVSRYQHPTLNDPPPKYAGQDATDLADLLRGAGYKVTLLADDAGGADKAPSPTKKNIDDALARLLEGAKAGDTVLVALSGQGIQFDPKDAYFCPADARPFADRTETLLSLSALYRQMGQSFAKVKVLLVDACRFDAPNAAGAEHGPRGVTADSLPDPPRGVAALFSCSAGQRAYEHESLRHGLFFHYVMDGLRSRAADAGGDVTFDGLSSYVRRRVPAKAAELFPGEKPRQTPGRRSGPGTAPATLVTVKPQGGDDAFRGVAVQVQDVNRMDDYRKAIDRIAAVGADTVEFVVSARQENGASSNIFLDMRCAPTPEQLGSLIRHARERKLRVVLMPIVLLQTPRDNEWRGTIAPGNWADWFESYRAMIYYYADLAETHHLDLFVVGSELVSSENNEAEWGKTIDGVRERFKGKLTYSSNWDRYEQVPFWGKLDMIGMNGFWTLGADHTVDLAGIETAWRGVRKGMVSFSDRMNKPVILLEIGWCSLENAANEPWDYTKTDLPLDLDLQRRLYEGFFRTWYREPDLGGFLIWEWVPGETAADDKGFSPHNKPAEKVLADWLGKGPWEVK